MVLSGYRGHPWSLSERPDSQRNPAGKGYNDFSVKSLRNVSQDSGSTWDVLKPLKIIVIPSYMAMSCHLLLLSYFNRTSTQ